VSRDAEECLSQVHWHRRQRLPAEGKDFESAIRLGRSQFAMAGVSIMIYLVGCLSLKRHHSRNDIYWTLEHEAGSSKLTLDDTWKSSEGGLGVLIRIEDRFCN